MTSNLIIGSFTSYVLNGTRFGKITENKFQFHVVSIKTKGHWDSLRFKLELIMKSWAAYSHVGFYFEATLAQYFQASSTYWLHGMMLEMQLFMVEEDPVLILYVAQERKYHSIHHIYRTILDCPERCKHTVGLNNKLYRLTFQIVPNIVLNSMSTYWYSL